MARGCWCWRLAGPSRPRPRAPPAPVDVIFDTDMALDVDDVGALALLHALADRGEARLLAIGISETARHDNGVWAAPMADVIDTYFGRPDIPIGVFRGPHQKRRKIPAATPRRRRGRSRTTCGAERTRRRRTSSTGRCWPAGRTAA